MRTKRDGSDAVKSAPLRNPKQESQRLLGSWPQLPEERFAAAYDEVPKNNRDDDRVVELPRDRDEVRNEIEWQRKVGHEPKEEHLAAPGDAWITEKATHEDDAVRNERGQSARISAPPAQ